MSQFSSEHHEELPPEYVESDFGFEPPVFAKRSEIGIGHLLAECKDCLARFGFDRDFFALHDHGGKALVVLMRVFLSDFNICPISRNAKREVATPFPREEELTEKLKRLDELNAELNMDKPENELVDGERDGDETPSESKESRPKNDRQEREQDDDREEECR